ncbi:ATP phosphoribosyltransferase regulatory subunit [Thalassoporum mexicanum PCC 7367]|uniref:ATP phosphoribosyltransferase regulatory subunit n=1 Tax=Thalassoporum mexicanum TaxID=3457544 RepID=UPI00029F968F|nr:ATP phosphoribosyltransferase regulatory subunit [Pseudanabaena sp. PCC 7367]AFY68627.1 ATP phosphoribosyltransferase regulatory subunit [Pseudanabaena sp. PCC 7367]
MVHHLPTGAKDLLPLDVAQKHWIESRLQDVFQSWGYQRIITPTLERLETLTAGGAVRPEAVIQLRDNDSEILGLRPELTASIARAYAPRLDKDRLPHPQRLYYNANIFRQLPASGYPSQQEYYQSGVELLGGSGVIADAEVLLLLAECLKQLRLDQWQIILGEAGLTSKLLKVFPRQCAQQVRHCIAHLDRVQLESLDIAEEQKNWALQLFELRGTPRDVLNKVKSLPWTSKIDHELEHLRALVETWEAFGLADRMVLDLSLIQPFDYYTGIVFEVISNNAIVAQGGRYDQLLGLYHPQGKSFPSVGFCLNLEDLQKVLGAVLPLQSPPSRWLVVATNETTPKLTQAIFAHASKLRHEHQGQSVEIELESRSPDVVRTYARSRRISQIAWVSDVDKVMVETVD